MARNISEMESGEKIRFCKPKSYEFIKALKPGGTGKTILMQDTTINEKFVCKKYDPEQKEYDILYLFLHFTLYPFRIATSFFYISCHSRTKS